MEVDEVSADIAAVKRKVSTDSAPNDEAPLCNGDAKKTNGVNGEESRSSMEGEESNDSVPAKDKSSMNGDVESKSVNGDDKSNVSVMEIDDDDSRDSTSSAKDSKKSDQDETSQDSLLSGSVDKASKSNDDSDNSDCEMIEDDEVSNDKVEKKEKPESEGSKDDKVEKEKDGEAGKEKEGEGNDKNKKDDKEGDVTDDTPEKEEEPPKEHVDPIEEAARLKAEAVSKAKYAVMEKPAEITDMRPMAHLLHDIGMDLCRETVYSHLIKVQNKKLSQNKLGEKETEQLEKLKDAQVDIKKKNEAFNLDTIKCPSCSFKTESKNVLEWHLEFAHGQDQETYQCSFCSFLTKMPGVFFYHMENEHRRKGRIYMRSAQFSCPLCPFENNKRATMNKHRMRCEKVFSTRRNLEPSPTDCDIPLKKTKKQLAAAAAASQARGSRHQPNIITRANPPPLQPKPVGSAILNTGMGMGNVAQTISQVVRPGMPGSSTSIQLAAQAIAQQAAQNVLKNQRKTAAPIPLSGQIPGGMIPMYPPGTTQAQILAGSVRPTHYAIGNQLYQIVQTRGQFMLQPVQQTSQFQIKSATKPVQPRPTPQQKAEIDLKSALEAVQKNVERKQAEEKRKRELMAKGKGAGNFEICEICGGFVKDRDSLHIHFFWAHKVEINKEVFQQHQPHLICEICRSRFWTFQGLHRHRQISHGAGGKGAAILPKVGQNLYKCYMCGDKVAYLATHLSEKHNVSIQQMFKAKKCYVCGLNFDNQKSLEKHLVKNHRELLTPQKFKAGGSPVPTGLYQHASPKKSKTFQPECSICNIKFTSLEKFSQHCNDYHIFKCYRCSEKWSSQELLTKHMWDAHRTDTDECQICKEKVKIGRPYIRHMRNSHLKKNSVVLTRLDQKLVEEDNKRWEKRKAEYDKQAAEQKAKMVAEAAKRAAEAWAKRAEAAAAQKAQEKDDVVVVGAAVQKKKSEDVICLDSDEDEPPAKKPALDDKSDEQAKDKEEKKENESDDEAKISSEVMEVDGEKIVIEQQDEADTSNNSGKEEEKGEAQEDKDGEEAQDSEAEKGGEEVKDRDVQEANNKNEEGQEANDKDESAGGSSDVEMVGDEEEKSESAPVKDDGGGGDTETTKDAKSPVESKKKNGEDIDLENLMEVEES